MMLLLWIGQVAVALPMYAQRSGRTCGNCHESPTIEDEAGWDNPSWWKRKCTMTCVSCHVDPTGGGLRNTSGRYFGGSTLAVIPTQDRSYSDHGREVFDPERVHRMARWLGRRSPPRRHVPSNFEEARAGLGQGMTGGVTVVGSLGEPVRMSFWDGRYSNLAADPILQLGGDIRGAAHFADGATRAGEGLHRMPGHRPQHVFERNLRLPEFARIDTHIPGQQGNGQLLGTHLPA